MKTVKITTEYINLGQFLKYNGIIANGSEAKSFLLIEKVLVNNEIEKRRGRKLYCDDIIEVKSNTYIIKK